MFVAPIGIGRTFFKGAPVRTPKKSVSMPPQEEAEGDTFTPSRKAVKVKRSPNGRFKINYAAIERLEIENFRLIRNQGGEVIGISGETLSGRNRKYLSEIKQAGVKKIIDLRTSDCTGGFKRACELTGLEYENLPIDKSTPVKDVIKILPGLISSINEGCFYVSCAQGLQRTDVALALNYLFNPDVDISNPPALRGHLRRGVFVHDDIFGRANDVFRNLTPEDKEKIGCTSLNEVAFRERKKALMARQNLALIEGMAY